MACIFCAIVRGDTPCFKLHEDDLTITFLDKFPAARGHALIVTKEHYDDIFSVAREGPIAWWYTTPPWAWLSLNGRKRVPLYWRV